MKHDIGFDARGLKVAPAYTKNTDGWLVTKPDRSIYYAGPFESLWIGMGVKFGWLHRQKN